MAQLKKLGMPALPVCLTFLSAGCVAQRGIDFGVWGGNAERIEFVRVTQPPDSPSFQGDETVLLLPPMGNIATEQLERLNRILSQEIRNYFPITVFEIEANDSLKRYISKQNLVPFGDKFDAEEVARIGGLLGVSHVLCTFVRDYRPHPPQNLALYLSLIETSERQISAEVNADFDATEQQVVMALRNYLQRRRARVFDKTSLEIMLRSPSEYQAFAMASCSQELAEELWNLEHSQ